MRARAVHVCVHVTDNDTLTASKTRKTKNKENRFGSSFDQVQ